MLQPRGELVVVEYLEQDTVSKGGIVLSGYSKLSNYRKATVKAVGKGYYQNAFLIPIEFQVGSTVLVVEREDLKGQLDRENPNLAIIDHRDILGTIIE